MKPLTPSEKRLTLLFGALLLGYAHWWGYGEWQVWERRSQQKESDLQAEKTAAGIFMENQNLWNERQDFMVKNQPKATDPDLASAALVDLIQKSTQTHQLTITDITLLPSKPLAHAFQTTAVVKITGKFENVTRWMYELQSPQNFTALERTSLKSDANPPQVLAEFEINRWYQPLPSKP